MDSNHQPNDYESFALPLSYGPSKDDSIGPKCWGRPIVAFGNLLFVLGIGFVFIGLIWRSRWHRSGNLIHRRFFFASPLIVIVIGVIIAIVSLYFTGEL
ncbi:uncharacterized protein METZ01_LOCUS365129 [marine metagenome]|uniref:Uncharacterized protein n=1 Tax=marine metagenome TaxID=408172 RepID=A0A382SS22_9ZZZZ